MMNTALNGWFRIHCPNCAHIHYRKVTEGQITEERFNNLPGKDDPFIIEDIKPMKASCRDFKKEKTEPVTGAFFLRELWKDFHEAKAA
jgi:hypothetical protein